MSTPRRFSKQRQLILDTIKTDRCHPTADAIYKVVSETNPEISLGTVYRNLNLLVEMGEIARVESASAKEHFDGEIGFHPHFICKSCGEIYDLEIPEIKAIDDSLRKRLEHRAEEFKLIIQGTCKACLNCLN